MWEEGHRALVCAGMRRGVRMVCRRQGGKATERLVEKTQHHSPSIIHLASYPILASLLITAGQLARN